MHQLQKNMLKSALLGAALLAAPALARAQAQRAVPFAILSIPSAGTSVCKAPSSRGSDRATTVTYELLVSITMPERRRTIRLDVDQATGARWLQDNGIGFTSRLAVRSDNVAASIDSAGRVSGTRSYGTIAITDDKAKTDPSTIRLEQLPDYQRKFFNSAPAKLDAAEQQRVKALADSVKARCGK